jgi:hypothetical protein
MMKNRSYWPPFQPTSGRETLCLRLAFLLMCSLAFVPCLRATGDLDWPYDIDIFRDIAHAQTIQDGSFRDDPLFLGETLWYNPLVPALVAGVAGVTGLPVHRVYTRLGTYVNLLAPITLYLLVASLLGEWTALASAFAFLFVIGLSSPSWLSPSYSPWLFSANFVQALFYLTLLVCLKVLRERSYRAHLQAGLGLGVTFLGHAAPAVILAVILTVLGLEELLRPGRHGKPAGSPWQVIARYALTFTVALLVSAPFLASIVGHYHLHVRNQAPSSFTPEVLDIAHLSSFLPRTPFAFAITAGVIMGVLGLYRRPPTPREGRIYFLWLGASLVLLVYGVLVHTMRARGIHLPNLVPASHFFFYLKAAESLLLGCGIVYAGHALAERIRAWRPDRTTRSPSPMPSHPGQLSAGLTAGLIVVSLLAWYPRYLHRSDFVEYRREAVAWERWQDAAAFDWIRQHSQTHDVFLATDRPSLFLVGTAGRKVVAAGNFHSNPYVDWYQRDADRNRMLRSVAEGDRRQFQQLASQYRVTHVLLEGDERQAVSPRTASFLHPEYTSEKLTIYGVRLSPSSVAQESLPSSHSSRRRLLP